MPNPKPTYIRNSRWRLFIYAFCSSGLCIIILYNLLFNHGKFTGNFGILWCFVILLALTSLYTINNYRNYPIEIELTTTYIAIAGEGIFEWKDIKHIGTESQSLKVPTIFLILNLHNNKKIKKDISDLEIKSKELFRLIEKYIEVGKSIHD